MPQSSLLFLLAVPSTLLFPSTPLLAQGCCGGGGGSTSLTNAFGPAPAVTSIRVEYNSASNTPASLKYGDYTLPLQPNSDKKYDLAPVNGSVPPLPGERVPVQLLGADGVSPPPADAKAEVDQPNEKTCPALGNTGNSGIGSGNDTNPKLDSTTTQGEDNAGGGNGDKGSDERPPSTFTGWGDGQGHGDAANTGNNRGLPGTAGDGGMSTDGGGLYFPSGSSTAQVVPAQLDFSQNLGQAASGNRPAGYVIPANTTLFNPLKYASYRVRGSVSDAPSTEYYQSGIPFAKMITTAEGVTIIEENAASQTMTFSTWNASQLDMIPEPPAGLPGQNPITRKIIAAMSLTDPLAPPNAATLYHSGYRITVQENGTTVSTRIIYSNASPTSNPTEAPGATSGTQYRYTVDEYPALSIKVQETWSSVRTTPPTNNERLVTSQVDRFINGNLTSRGKQLTRYKLYAWGEEVIQRTADPDGVNRITTYAYWDSIAASDPSYSRQKLVTNSDGSWAASYRTKVASSVVSGFDYIDHSFSPWQNQAAPAASATFADLDALKPNGRYVKTNSRADYRYEREEYVKNQIVGKTLPDATSTSWYEITKNYFGAGAADFFASVTVKDTSLFYNGLTQSSYRLVQGTTDPWTSANVISWTRFSRSNAIPSATSPFYEQQPGTSLSHPYDVTDVLENPQRLPCRFRRTVADRLTGKTIATAEYLATSLDGWGLPNYSGGLPDPATNTLLDQQTSSWDAQGQPVSVSYLDGRTETWGYGPGSRVTYKDASDVTTVTESDEFDRPSMEAIQGAGSVGYTGSFGSRTLPASDWVVSTWNYTARAGNAMGGKTTITTTAMTGLPGSGSPVAGGWTRVRESEYDGESRLIRFKSAIGRESFFLYSTPAWQGARTIVALDAAGNSPLSQTTTYLDGRTDSITGPAKVPAYYRYDATTPWKQTFSMARDPAFTTSQGVETTETNGLGRTIRVTLPRSVDSAGALLPATNEIRDYNTDGLVSLRTSPGPNGQPIYDHYSYTWSTSGPSTRIITSYRSDSATPGAGTITARTVVETFLENSSGLWWNAARTKIGAAGAEETAQETRTAAGPMNLTSGYDRSKITSIGTTEESITSRGSGGSWHETKLSRNGVLVDGSIDRNGLNVFARMNGTMNKAITWSPLRESLMEPRSDSTGWVTLTRDPAKGLVTSRTGPGVSETLAYYPLAGDPTVTLHRTGRLWKRTPTLVSKGPEFYDYNARGQVTAQWGSGTYPQANGYDSLGRQTTLTTFRSANGQSSDPDNNPDTWVPNTTTTDAATTTWVYPPFLDLILSKRYQGTVAPANDIAYTYKPNAQLATRLWKRGVTTTYSYLNNGNPTTISYAGGEATPTVSFTWDAAGRNTGRTDAGGTWALTYAADGRLKKETTGSTGKSVEWLYDSFGRRQTLKSQFSSTTTAPDVTYGYNSYSQLSSAASSVTSVALGWSPFISRPSLKNYAVSSVLLDQYSSFNTNGEMTQAYSYSNYYAGGFVVDDTTFTRNALGQITLRSTPPEGQRWNYQYDARGQVSKAHKTFISAPQQVAAGTQAQYSYDQIGNRLQWQEGGTSTLDSGLRIHTYGTGVAGGSANALNQYGSITQPQSFDVTGTRATGTTTIGVTAGTNPPSTVSYQQNAGTGLYFRADVAHNAANNTRFSPVNVTANSSTIDSWLQYVPPATEPLNYDADGNLTSDGRWNYKWDGENRLIRMDSVAQSNPTVKSMRLVFTYDGLSRRIRKDVFQDSPAHTVPPPTNGTLTKSEHYLYQGWNLVLTALDNGVGTAGSNTGGNLNKRVASYVWGPDIGSSPSGRRTWQGAGGVGGLLIVTDGVDSSITYTGVDYNGAAAGNGTAPADPTNDHYMPLIDHLGNITAYYSGVGGSLTLQGSLEYDAFGRETRSTGPACDKAPFHFSSKFTDPETGLNYYGYRFYDPNNGRWVNRDPIGEMGGLNLYGMVKNNGLGFFDALGLDAGIGIGRTIAAIGESASTAGGEATAAAMAEMVGAEMTGGGLASAIIGGTGLVVATIALTPLSETERRKALREECEEIQKRKEAAKAKNEAPNKQRRGRKPANCWAECSIFEDLLKNAIELLHLRKEWDDMDCDADLDWPGNETEADRRAKHLPELKAARNAVAKAEEALMECQNARARRQ